MKQQVDITLKLSLWIDASLTAEQIEAHVGNQILEAFGEAAAGMSEPVTIYEVREEARTYGNLAQPTPFDDYEVHGVREFGSGRRKYCEQVPDQQAQFFGLYGHIPGEGLVCIGDFKTREFAEEICERITARPYSIAAGRETRSC